MAGNSNGQKAIKAGIGYTIGNILVKGISFISIPVFARLLTVSDYGVVNTYSAYTSVLFVIIGFALHASIKNAKIDYPDKLKEYSSSVSLLAIYNALFLIVLAACFSTFLAGRLSLPKRMFPILIVVSSFSMAMTTFYSSVLSAEYQYKEYVGVSLAYALLGIISSIVLVVTVYSEERYTGRILGMIIADIVICAYIIWRLFRNARPKNNREYWKYGLKISLPIVPHGLSQIVLAQFDRLMINSIIGSFEAGIYSFAYNVGVIFQVVATSLDTAWSQWFFDEKAKGNDKLIRKTANIYCIIVTVGAVALMLIAPELITVLGTGKYSDSRAVALPIVLAMFYSYMYYFPASVEYYHKKTNLIAIGTVCAAISNIILNTIYIKKYGYIAAAYTTVVCYLAYYIFHVFISYRVEGRFIYDMKVHFLVILAVTISMFLCLTMLDAVLVRMIIFLILMVALIIIGIAKKDEIKKIWKNLA